eukprot:Skav236740  [mRNA]  locus=scaffold2899:10148:11055:- [translate_table: standard]
MQDAGDCIGDLERCMIKLFQRPLSRTEPSYRFRPRPGNVGDYVAIVRLEALDPPMEFVGDAYKLKQTAKHSAALQALNYLDSWRKPCAAYAIRIYTDSRQLHL